MSILFGIYLRIFWNDRLLISVSVFIGVLCSVIYLYFATPISEAKAYLVSPVSSALPSMNAIAEYSDAKIGDNRKRHKSYQEVTKYTDVPLFKIYQKYLFSQKIKKAFFDSYYLPAIGLNKQVNGSYSQYLSFQKALNIKLDSESAELTLRAPNVSQSTLRSLLLEYLIYGK